MPILPLGISNVTSLIPNASAILLIRERVADFHWNTVRLDKNAHQGAPEPPI